MLPSNLDGTDDFMLDERETTALADQDLAQGARRAALTEQSRTSGSQC